MRIALTVLAVLAAVDVLIFGVTLAAIGYHYRRMRQKAAAAGEVLAPATGQFLFVGLMVAAGVAALVGSIFGLVGSL